MNRPETLRVFIDGKGVDVPTTARAIDAVEALDKTLALAVSHGEKILTDSRGLPIDGASALQSGAIFRIIPKRDRSAQPTE
jgi:hypothetical protein